MTNKLFSSVVAAAILGIGLSSFQSPTLAGPRADEGDMRIVKHQNHEMGGGGGVLWGPPKASRAAHNHAVKNGQEIERGRVGSGDISDRQRRDIVKEVTGRSHIGRGGPQ